MMHLVTVQEITAAHNEYYQPQNNGHTPVISATDRMVISFSHNLLFRNIGAEYLPISMAQHKRI